MWVLNARAVRDFLYSAGRYPESSTDPGEQMLCDWMEAQRRSAQKGRLSPERHSILDRALPGWRRSRDEVWSERLAAVLDGQMTPLLRTWLGSQRRSHAEGTLRADRLAALNDALPDWLSLEGRRWEEAFDSLGAWIREHGRLPGYTEKDGDQVRLYRWLVTQRNLAARGGLAVSKAARLRSLHPRWEQSINGPWEIMAAAVAAHIAATGRRPAVTSPEERRMARWLGTQRASLRSGKLNPVRTAWLNDNVPGWAGRLEQG